MAHETGQFSWHHPAVVFEETFGGFGIWSSQPTTIVTGFFMLTSLGRDDWSLGPDTNQTSGAAPALSIYQSQQPKLNLLVLVFVANDPSNRILYSILDLNEDPNTRGWRYVGQVGNESAQAVFTPNLPPNFITVVYFTANDSSDRLLNTGFIPATP